MGCLIVFFFNSGEKSGQDILLGHAGIDLLVDDWMSTDDETRLQLRDPDFMFLKDVISILALFCPAVKHFSIDLCRIHRHPFTHMPMPMISVITVCIKSLNCRETLHETLLAVSNFFPNAEKSRSANGKSTFSIQSSILS